MAREYQISWAEPGEHVLPADFSPRVFVITPYHDEPEAWLRTCVTSVRRQSWPCVHVMVADGRPQAWLDREPGVQHVVLPKEHADFGDTPRAVGTVLAWGQSADAVAYLDADNWYRREHVRSLLALQHRTGASVLSAMRSFHHLDGRLMGIDRSSDGEVFSDTNCLLLMRSALPVSLTWASMDPAHHAIDDRVVWKAVLDSGLPRANSDLVSVAYRVNNAGLYERLRWPTPPSVPDGSAITQALQDWRAAGHPEADFPFRAIGYRPELNKRLPLDGRLMRVAKLPSQL